MLSGLRKVIQRFHRGPPLFQVPAPQIEDCLLFGVMLLPYISRGAGIQWMGIVRR